MSSRREPIYGLDLIRFFAAGMVVFWHFGYRFFDPDAGPLRNYVAGIPVGWHPWQAFAQWGWVGVQIFFVISGVVISYSATNATPWGYFVGRFGRLWPGTLITVAIVLLIELAFWHHPPMQLIVPFYRTVLFSPIGPWLIPPFWSLPIEIVFYLYVWLLIVQNRVDRINILAIVLLVASTAYWAMVLVLHINPPFPTLARLLLFEHGIYFALGIFLSQLDRGNYRVSQIAMILLTCIVAPVEIRHSILKYGLGETRAAEDWLYPYLIWLAAVGLMWGSLHYRSAVSKVISPRASLSKASRIIGLATFPLYLLHISFGGMIATITIALGLPIPASLILAAVLTVFLSAGVAVFCEPWLRKIVVNALNALQRTVTAKFRAGAAGIRDQAG